MPHKDWCGKPCAECENPCKLDESIPCSPDCGYLGSNGELHLGCVGCDAAFDEEIDGVVYILVGFFDNYECGDHDFQIMGVYKTRALAESTVHRYVEVDSRYNQFVIEARTVEEYARPGEKLKEWYYNAEED